MLADRSPAELSRIYPIVMEELGYGDFGLALTAFMGRVPAFAVRTSNFPDRLKQFEKMRGCWIATQPDRGSDAVDYKAFELAPGAKQGLGGMRARVTSTEIILTGCSSQWIAGSAIAECALVHCPADYGDGFHRPDGGIFGAVLLVPLDFPGITRVPPCEKLGQRSLSTSQVIFDEVRLPLEYLVRPREEFHLSFHSSLTSGVMSIGALSVGVARAAFEHAYQYAQQRHQGGVVLAQHQHIKWRLYEMWRKVEMARAMIRRAVAYNFSENGPHVLASATAKITATTYAREVVSEATQIWGANGVGSGFPLEKLLRDIQVAMMEGGENHFFSLQAANWLYQAYGSAGSQS